MGSTWSAAPPGGRHSATKRLKCKSLSEHIVGVIGLALYNWYRQLVRQAEGANTPSAEAGVSTDVDMLNADVEYENDERSSVDVLMTRISQE